MTKKRMITIVVILICACLLASMLIYYATTTRTFKKAEPTKSIVAEVNAEAENDTEIEYLTAEKEFIISEDDMSGISDDTVPNLSLEQKAMLYPLSILCCYYDEYNTYDPFEDTGWNIINIMADDFGHALSDYTDKVFYSGNSSVVILDTFLKQTISAMYSGFSGDIPIIEDINSSSGVQNQTKNGYTFKTDGKDTDKKFTFKSWKHNSDGTDTVILTETGSSMDKDYEFTVVPNGYTESLKNPDFQYSVSGMRLIGENKADKTSDDEHSAQNDMNTGSNETDMDEQPTQDAETDTADEENEETEEQNKNSEDYMLPESDSRYYERNELNDLTDEELRIARNEIYARHGYIFGNSELNDYFNEKSWYQPTLDSSSFDASVFSDYENKNLNLILDIENSRK